MELKPTEDWTPMPKECRENYQVPGSSLAFHTRFIAEVVQALEAHEVEVEWRTVVDKPDSRNKYWWRIKPQGFPFDRLFVGDVLSCPYPACNKLRLRVRSIEHYVRMLPGGGYTTEKYPNYTLQLYTVRSDGTGKYGWMDSSHDRNFSIEYIKEHNYRLIEKAPGQPSLF